MSLTILDEFGDTAVVLDSTHAYLQDDGSVIIIEQERFTRIGYSKASWDDRRVLMWAEEIMKLAAMVAK